MSGTGAPRVRRRAVLFGVAAVAMTLGSTASQAPMQAGWVDSSDYARDCLAVGAAVNAPGGATPENFRAAAADLGPLSMRRSFDSSLPRDHASSAAGVDAELGVRSFLSWKPPRGDFRGAARGRYDEQVTAWARSVPPTGVFATSFHEPENDMTAQEFVRLQRHLYTVVKAANPTIRWGPVYMAYWWDPGEPGHWVGQPAAWWPGEDFADFSALDWYGPQPEPMTRTAAFRTWYEFMVRTPVPLYIAEYGQYAVGPGETSDPALEQARADAIRTDAAWIADHPRIRMWLYWQGTGDQGDWRIRDAAGRAAWREVAASGCAA